MLRQQGNYRDSYVAKERAFAWSTQTEAVLAVCSDGLRRYLNSSRDALTEQGPDKEIPLVRTSIHGASTKASTRQVTYSPQ